MTNQLFGYRVVGFGVSGGGDPIDIGDAAISRASTLPLGFTRPILANPANATGKLTSVELWFATSATSVKIGTASKSGDNFTIRDYETIGSVTGGSKQTFSSLNINVVVGDYIIIYWAAGTVEYSTAGGSGSYYKSGDQFGLGVQTYTSHPDGSGALSVYGIGIT